MPLIFVACLVREVAPLHCVLLVSTPLGKTVQCESYYLDCKVQVGNFILSTNLIILAMKDFDEILGMDWLSIYKAVIDCFNKTVRLEVLEDIIEIVGERKPMSTRIVSALRADTLIRRDVKVTWHIS